LELVFNFINFPLDVSVVDFISKDRRCLVCSSQRQSYGFEVRVSVRWGRRKFVAHASTIQEREREKEGKRERKRKRERERERERAEQCKKENLIRICYISLPSCNINFVFSTMEEVFCSSTSTGFQTLSITDADMFSCLPKFCVSLFTFLALTTKCR